MNRITATRRSLLAGALGAAATASVANAQAQRPTAPTALPFGWTAAESLSLWSDSPPSGGFVPQSTAIHFPVGMVHNVAVRS